MKLGIPEISITLILLILLVMFIWTLTHCVKNKELDGPTKALWILALLIFPVIGSLAYVTFAPSGRE